MNAITEKRTVKADELPGYKVLERLLFGGKLSKPEMTALSTALGHLKGLAESGLGNVAEFAQHALGAPVEREDANEGL
jgi:hypothetical protein